ncbi:MAG: biotin--[acetyl-CoA-carboxylase] ligase [Verrucomicrobiota bacterium]|nr:biotin--[acetyl-CoA-carboxylase] ligase [Verrucomicrobiota bacterium]
MDKTTLHILNILKSKENYISGEDISSKLDISRTGVWKHINKLKKLGYSIKSVSRKGYSLESITELPLPHEIRTNNKHVNWKIIFRDSLNSTNQTASELAIDDAETGTVIVADSQTCGRGRMQRKWDSPPGKNLYFSIILRPPITPLRTPQIAIITAVSLQKTLKRLFPDLDSKIKWPNDILVDGKKLAGILCEMKSESDCIHHVILGIGLNINTEKNDFPEEIADSATSILIETKKKTARAKLLSEILNDFEQTYNKWLKDNDLGSIKDEWEKESCLIGKKIKIKYFNKIITGTPLGITFSGELLLKKEDNTIQKIVSGDVHVIR